jgi:hypothetical protein
MANSNQGPAPWEAARPLHQQALATRTDHPQTGNAACLMSMTKPPDDRMPSGALRRSLAGILCFVIVVSLSISPALLDLARSIEAPFVLRGCDRHRADRPTKSDLTNESGVQSCCRCGCSRGARTKGNRSPFPSNLTSAHRQMLLAIISYLYLSLSMSVNGR